MKRCDDAGSRIGLEFFGTVSASISHELKNALAIINESAGLLEDFTLMAQKGLPLDPERLGTVAGRIQRQIQRADGIVKNMNRFAHSIDDPLRDVDPGDIARFVAALSQRMADRQSVTLEVEGEDLGSTILIDPYCLQHLVWRCIRFALPLAGAGKRIGMKVEQTTDKIHIRLNGLEEFPNQPSAEFPGEEERLLLVSLGAELIISNGSLTIALPKNP